MSEEDNMELRKMHERISELEHKQSQIRKENTDMQLLLKESDEAASAQWLENTMLSNRMKTQEQCVSEAEQASAEVCRLRTLLTEEQSRSTCKENTVRRLEKAQRVWIEHNEMVTAELNSLYSKGEKEQAATCLLSIKLKTLMSQMDEAWLRLQNADEAIQQHNWKFEHLEQAREESSEMIMDLKQRLQDLKSLFEGMREEAVFAGLDNVVSGNTGSSSHLMSLEMELLTTEGGRRPSALYGLAATGYRTESTEVEEQDCEEHLESRVQTRRHEEQPESRSQTKSWCSRQAAGTLILVLVLLMVLGVLVSMASGGYRCFINFLWTIAHHLTERFFTLHHMGLPPI